MSLQVKTLPLQDCIKGHLPSELVTSFAHLRSYLVHWKLTTEAHWERCDAADEKNAAASELWV